MKAIDLSFNDKELSLLRKVLTNRILDLRLDELTSMRVGLPTKSIRKELLFTDSLLSKLG